MDKVVVISVVRDFAMYGKCLADNPCLAGAERVVFDNRAKNEPIPVLYNRFLDAFDFARPAWFVFCHEDFQPLESLVSSLEKVRPDALWGPVGACTVWRWKVDPHFTILGQVRESSKDGGGLRMLGTEVGRGAEAETLDCMCVVAHSSTVARHGLRFDVRFPFDLYVEDFCVGARGKGIPSCVLPMACRHWSRGVMGERYRAAERAFSKKWPQVCATGTSSEVLGGGAGVCRRLMLSLKRTRRRFLSSTSLRGMSWSLAGRMLIKAVQFGFSILLARLLCPADFGLVGMTTIFMALADVVMGGGLVAALIRKKERTEADYATVFWCKAVMALVAYAVLFACAPLVAAFYHTPQLTSVMRVAALGIVLVMMSSVFHARLVANCRFRDLAVVSTVAILLSGSVGFAMAWRGLGVWAVVGQGLSWHAFTLGLLVGANRWLPKKQFSVASLRALFGFGWKHLLRGVLDTLYGNAYSVAVGKGFGAADLGLYNRADYYTSEAGGLVGGVIHEVNYPILSAMQDDNAKLRRAYRRLQLIAAGVMIPGMAFLAVFAEPLVRYVIGPQWLGCVSCLRVLAFGAALSPLVGLAYLPMYVKGRTDLALKLDLVEKPLAFLLLLASIPFGILAVCAAKSLSSVLFFVVNACVSRRLLYGT